MDTITENKPLKQQKSHRLFRSTSLVAGLTFLSRIAGFLRDVVLAIVFGAGPAFDAFVVAFKIPNFLRRLFAEGAFSQAFVPLLSEYKEKKTHAETQEFINRVTGTLATTVFAVVILAEIFAPILVFIFAPGFMKDPVRYHWAVTMLRITFPYLAFITMAALAWAILNTYGKFLTATASPIFLSFVLIFVAWFLAPRFHISIYALAWGVLIGGVGQVVMQIPRLIRLKLLPRPKLGFKDPGVLRVMKLMVPALFGVSVAQLSLVVDNFFASFLPEGSISWLYFSDRLTFLPVGVIGVALATVVMPHLSRHMSNEAHDLYSQTLDWSLRCTILVGIPAGVGLLVLAGPVLATLMHHGAFNNYDVLMTRRSLMAYSVGLPGFMLVKILASAFYSRQNIRTPVKVAAIAVAVNIILNILLVGLLKHAGLALSTALASLVNAGLLFYLLLKQKSYQPSSGWRAFLYRILLGNIVMTIFIVALSGHIQWWLDSAIFERICYLTLIIALGIISYLATLWLSGMRMKDFHPPS